MRRKFLLFIITGCFVLNCCKVNYSHVSPITTITLNKVIDGWCSNLCDYPKSLDEFVSYAEEYDSWKNQPIKDSLQSTLTFLKEEKEHITWQFIHPTVTTINLTILYYDDTICKKCDKLPFSGLDVSLYSYNYYHLEYPSSIEELIAYDSLSKCLHQGFYQCCDATFDYLLKNKDKVEWRKGDGEILIMAGNDTIAFHGDDSQIQYCDEFITSPGNVFRFFDIGGRYAYSEDLERALKIGLKQFQENQFIAIDGQSVWHILEYTPNSGLQPFCNNDSIQLDTKWFHNLEDYMYEFCYEHNLGRVIFVTQSYQKQQFKL